MTHPILLRLFPSRLAICRLPVGTPAPEWAYSGDLSAVIVTPDETTVVCEERSVPEYVVFEAGWRFFRVESVLDFSLVGVLARLSACLSAAGVSIFALSSFDTDYILVKEKDLPAALKALVHEGYQIQEP